MKTPNLEWKEFLIATNRMNNPAANTGSPQQHLQLFLTVMERLTTPINSGAAPVTELRNLVPQHSENSRLQWTFPKIALVELIYSLKELGAFNNGKADLKTITQCFEQTFSIELGNVSSSFQEILERKKGYTNITDKLRDVFLKKVDGSGKG